MGKLLLSSYAPLLANLKVRGRAAQVKHGSFVNVPPPDFQLRSEKGPASNAVTASRVSMMTWRTTNRTWVSLSFGPHRGKRLPV